MNVEVVESITNEIKVKEKDKPDYLEDKLFVNLDQVENNIQKKVVVLN